MNINILSAPAGSGKTHTMSKQIAFNSDEKYLIVLFTKQLSNQWHIDLKDKNICYIDRVDTDNHNFVSNQIEQTIIAHNDNNDGGVVLITYQALLNGKKWWHLLKDWNLVIDEIPNSTDLKSFNISYSHNFSFNKFIDVERDGFGEPILFYNELYKLRVINNDIVKQNYDECYEKTKNLVRDMVLFDAYVESKNWDDVIIKNIIIDDKAGGKEENQLNVITVLTPRLFNHFKTKTILGANFNRSMLCQLWARLFPEVKWWQDTSILQSLQYQYHKNSNRLKFVVLTDKFYSIHQRNKKFDGYQCFGNKLADMAANTLKNDFLYVVNNNFYSKELHSTGEQIPVISHGSNAFKDKHKMYFGVALNLTPSHERVLKAFGLSRDEIRIARVCEIAYQSIMRTSLRDLNATEQVIIVVNDGLLPVTLKELYFNDCEIEYHPECFYSGVALSKQEQNKRCYEKKKEAKPTKKPALTNAEKCKRRREKIKLKAALSG